MDQASQVQLHAVRAGGLLLTVAADSQVGLRYPANFDVLAIDPTRPVVAVADGMGSGTGSAVAGRTTMDVFVSGVGAVDGRVTPAALRGAVEQAQRAVCRAAERLGEFAGCTLTAVVVDAGEAWVVHIGDSRVYRLRDDVLELLTVDHTVAWLGAIYGWYPAHSPDAHAARYQLLRFMGQPGEPEPDILNLALRAGDILCVCTDGLAEEVSYQRLAKVLAGGGEPADMVTVLLGDALAAGGRDNATVAVLRVDTVT